MNSAVATVRSKTFRIQLPTTPGQVSSSPQITEAARRLLEGGGVAGKPARRFEHAVVVLRTVTDSPHARVGGALLPIDADGAGGADLQTAHPPRGPTDGLGSPRRPRRRAGENALEATNPAPTTATGRSGCAAVLSALEVQRGAVRTFFCELGPFEFSPDGPFDPLELLSDGFEIMLTPWSGEVS